MQEFINNYVKMFTNAFDVHGNATLKEFWYPFIVNFILNMILRYIPVVGVIISLILCVPQITLGIRRLRDAGINPWFILIPFYNLYCFAQPSKN